MTELSVHDTLLVGIRAPTIINSFYYTELVTLTGGFFSGMITLKIIRSLMYLELHTLLTNSSSLEKDLEKKHIVYTAFKGVLTHFN